MAILTSGWQLIGRVIRICCPIIINLVTTHTGIGCIIVIPVVAGDTIVGNRGMCPDQWVVIIVDREAGRFPAWSRGVTHRTIRWNHERNMVGIQTRIVIWRVTARAGIGGVVVIAVVTGHTIVRNGQVCSGKRIDRVVVKSGWRPGSLAVTSVAVGRELRDHMVRIHNSNIIRSMASETGIRRVLVISMVAGVAVISNRSMRPVQLVITIVVKG